MDSAKMKFFPFVRSKSQFQPIPSVDGDLVVAPKRKKTIGCSWTLNAILILLTLLCILAWLGPALLTFYSEDKTFDFLKSEARNGKCDVVPEQFRFDCDPRRSANEEECLNNGCCWQQLWDTNKVSMGIPYCYYPTGFANYKLINSRKTKFGISADYRLTFPSGYPNDIKLVRMDVTGMNAKSLRVKIYDPNRSRFEAPLFYESEKMEDNFNHAEFSFRLSKVNFGFKIMRRNGDLM